VSLDAEIDKLQDLVHARFRPRHSSVACATLSRRSAKNPLSLALEGRVKDAVRVAACDDPGPFYGTSREVFPIRGALHPCSWVTVKRHDGRCDILRGVWLPLPRNDAKELLLMCCACGNPRRYLYGWEASGPYTSSVEVSHWMCRCCARLRYSSEGGYLCPGSILREFGNLPRPEGFWPHVFSSIDDPRLDEILSRA
jgi:hypothetical protein